MLRRMSSAVPDESQLPNLARHVGDAVRALLGSHGLELREVEDDDNELPSLAPDDLVAILTFGRPPVSGKLVIAASVPAILRTMPFAPTAGDERAAATDWLGELANQALGRFRERVSWQQGAAEIGTPFVFPLMDAPFGALDPEHTVGRTLVGGDAHLLAWCEFTAPAALQFDPTAPTRAGTRLF